MSLHTFNASTMLAYWPIDEAAGSFIDAGTHHYDAAAGPNAPTRETASTPWGARAAFYNADDTAMEVADDGAIATLLRTGTFSWTYWAKVDSSQVTRCSPGYPIGVHTVGTDWQILYSSDLGHAGEFGVIYAPQVGSPIDTTTYGYTVDVWHHFATVFTSIGGGNVQIDHYVDGVLQYTDPSEPAPDALGAMLIRFGRNYDPGAGQFNNQFAGRLSEVVLWKSALTAGDVLADYSLGQPPVPVVTHLPEPLAFGPAEQDFGVDLIAMPDCDGRFQLQGGLKNLGEALLRRLQTPAGSLFYDPDYGFDVRDLLNDGLTAQGLFAAQASIEAECEKDERVLSATASLELNTSTTSLSITIDIQTAAGPFQLVLAVDKVSVQILSAASA